MIFDGRAFAQQIEAEVAAKVVAMDVKPHVVSILIGEDPASVLYTGLKQKAAGRVGIEFEVVRLPLDPVDELKKTVKQVGERDDVTGLMIQMPVPGRTRAEQQDLLTAIPLTKDVDGLRWEESEVVPATVRAILRVLDEVKAPRDGRYVVVGSHGSVGKPLVYYLREKGIGRIEEINSDIRSPAEIIRAGDVVISCVGKAGLVTDVKEGAIVVDVGISKVDGKVVGDMTRDVYNKAGIAVAVPGGIGPVTVACLMSASAQL